ncbi:hypothetical protein [Chryseobacterium culicis]|uniref:hypothetical protein n=1 Tax=Chryseobacterium culicis TaxID=680127 RepID=UPI00289B2217|nr:hypothetical protein [Chryseobacterium culicis]
MKNLNLNIILLFVGNIAFSQVGINTPSPEATLDVRAKNHLGAVTSKDGVLVPRVNDLSASGSVNGQLVYLIADSGVFKKGFYYWNGTEWIGFGNAKAEDTTNDAWINDVVNTRVKLNSQSDGSTARPVGTEMVILDTGTVGIGIDSPTNKTDINGDLRVRTMITGQNTEYILSADSNGVLHRTTLTPQNVGDTNSTGSTILKNQYFGTMSDGTKTINAGIVEIRLVPLNGNSTQYNYPELRLSSAPTSNISVVVLDDETYNSGGTQGSAVTLNFTPSNYNNWQIVGNGTLDIDEKNVLTFSIPGTMDLYRVTCYVTKNSNIVGQERLYNIIVEKF